MANNMSINHQNIIILAITLLSFIVFASANSQTVNFATDVSEPVKITCKADGIVEADKTLVTGQNLSFNPKKTKDIYYCIVLWKNYFGSIQSFDPKRDAGHVSVFWKVQIKGLFFSYDDKSYDLFAPWQTE